MNLLDTPSLQHPSPCSSPAHVPRNHILQALTYYCICHALVENQSPSLGLALVATWMRKRSCNHEAAGIRVRLRQRVNAGVKLAMPSELYLEMSDIAQQEVFL